MTPSWLGGRADAAEVDRLYRPSSSSIATAVRSIIFSSPSAASGELSTHGCKYLGLWSVEEVVHGGSGEVRPQCLGDNTSSTSYRRHVPLQRHQDPHRALRGGLPGIKVVLK